MNFTFKNKVGQISTIDFSWGITEGGSQWIFYSRNNGKYEQAEHYEPGRDFDFISDMVGKDEILSVDAFGVSLNKIKAYIFYKNTK